MRRGRVRRGRGIRHLGQPLAQQRRFARRREVGGDLGDRVRDLLVNAEWVTNVTVQVDACVDPQGDLVECDVAREKAGVLLNRLGLAEPVFPQAEDMAKQLVRVPLLKPGCSARVSGGW